MKKKINKNKILFFLKSTLKNSFRIYLTKTKKVGRKMITELKDLTNTK